MRFKYFVIILVFFAFTSCQKNNKALNWPEPAVESKPWTRWWWPGNAVDRENISRELKELADAGIGGVEITSIYGVKGEEERFIEYLSSEFTDMLKFTIEEAGKLGMGVDLPPGSGWRCGGPFVPREKGLWSLRIHQYSLLAGEEFTIPAEIEIPAAVSFMDENGKVTVLNIDEPYTAHTAGKIYLAERYKNNDMVKRASDGGKGWAIDTFNDDITKWYLNEFWEKLDLGEGMIRCFFHDSFEYTGDFTTNFTEEFRKRRGYDLAEYLHALTDDFDNPETVRRVRSDYRETLSELVLESFIKPMAQWANCRGSMIRNQAHGSPGNILDIYAVSDIPETEIFKTIEPGSVNILVNKFASSAAHVAGRKLISSESFTWLDEHWQETPADMIRAVNRFFLSGVNHMIFHGTCYSPEDAEWPGWLFYASSQINNRNPLWREMPSLFKYIERAQTVLQQSIPQNELLVYWPYYDVIASEGRLFKNLNIDSGDNSEWFRDYPFAKLVKKLLDSGYTLDYISDRQLLNCEISEDRIQTEGKAEYKAVVVPEAKYIPVATMEKLIDFISEGGKVYFDGKLPESAPGLHNVEMRENQLETLKNSPEVAGKTGDVLQLLENDNINPEKSLTEKGFRHLKMKRYSEEWYMIFNCTDKILDERVELNTNAESYVLYFPENGEISLAENQDNLVRIQLEPERVVFVRCTDKKIKADEFVYEDSDIPSTKIDAQWKITFLKGAPVLPEDILTAKLVSWTEFGNGETAIFAGTALYTVEFDWNNDSNMGVISFEDIKDCARIRLNGKDFGFLPGPAFKIKVDNLVKGKNRLEAEVTNVAANRIRDLDIRGENWKKFYDINFVNIDYRPFDASGWEIREAGILGDVEVAAIK